MAIYWEGRALAVVCDWGHWSVFGPVPLAGMSWLCRSHSECSGSSAAAVVLCQLEKSRRFGSCGMLTKCLGALAAAEGIAVSTVVSKACLLGAWCGRTSTEGRGTGFLWLSSQLRC